MPALSLLVAAVVTNYIRHRRGQTTICQFTRAHVPRPVAIAGVTGIFGWLVPHLWRGYPN